MRWNDFVKLMFMLLEYVRWNIHVVIKVFVRRALYYLCWHTFSQNTLWTIFETCRKMCTLECSKHQHSFNDKGQTVVSIQQQLQQSRIFDILVVRARIYNNLKLSARIYTNSAHHLLNSLLHIDGKTYRAIRSNEHFCIYKINAIHYTMCI